MPHPPPLGLPRTDMYAASPTWSYHEGYQYTLIDTLESWSTQKAACEALGAALASILSDSEHEFAPD